MPRPEKVQAVEEIKERFENAEATFLTEYRGLTVNEQQELRRGLRATGAEYKVVKMSLARRAAKELGLDELTESMTGPTAIAFASTDPVPVARALKDFAKDHEHLVLKVGLMSGKLLPPEQISKLADIEPRDVLLGRIAGAFKAPLAKMAGMLGSFTRDSASMFAQLLEKKEESGEYGPSEEAEAPAAAEPEATEEVVDAEPASSAEAEEIEQPAAEAEEEAAEVEAETPDAGTDAEPEEEAAAEEVSSTDAEEDQEDETPEAAADDVEVDEGSDEEEAGSDDSATSDSDSDDTADKAEEE